MTIINTAKDGLLDQLRKNDRVREEENVQAAEDEESIPSDHNSDSESSGTSSEPASSHPRPWTSKKEVLDTIKKLYFMCEGSDKIEHLYILPLRWLFLLQFEKFHGLRLQLCHIQVGRSILKATCNNVQFNH